MSDIKEQATEVNEPILPEDVDADALLNQMQEKAKVLLGKLPLMGPVIWLYMNSPPYKHTFISELEWKLIPSFLLNQCKLYMKNEAPLAFVTWAFVNEEIESKF